MTLRMPADDVRSRDLSANASVRRLSAVLVIVTNHCNLSCDYCYQNKKGNVSIPWSTLRAALDVLLRSRKERVRLTFYGGEPLLEFPLIRRAIGYVESHRPRSLLVSYELVTNGVLITPEIARFLEMHEFLVQLSFDGIPAAQRHRGAGTYRILDGLFRRLAIEHPRLFLEHLKVASTVHPAAVESIPASVEYLLARGVREFTMAPSFGGNEPWPVSSIETLNRACGKAYRICLRHYERTGDVPLLLLRRGGPRLTHGNSSNLMCGAGRGEVLTVDVDGMVYGCPLVAESYQSFPAGGLGERLRRLRLGNIKSPTFVDRLNQYPRIARAVGMFDGKLAKKSSYGRCVECRWSGECRVCPVSICRVPGNDDGACVPDYLCAFNRVWSSHRSRFPSQGSAGAPLASGRRLPRLVREFDVWVRSRSGLSGRIPRQKGGV